MVHSLLADVKPENLVRVTLMNCVNSAAGEIDKFIGRTAHISYLDNPIVAQEVVYNLTPYFSA